MWDYGFLEVGHYLILISHYVGKKKSIQMADFVANVKVQIGPLLGVCEYLVDD